MTWPTREDRALVTRQVQRQNALAWFWTAVVALIVVGVIFMMVERASGNAAEVCVSSMIVEIGQAPVVNPVTCQ